MDLVNQGQLIAAIEHGVSARLVAPYKPREADLYAVISAFEAKYGAYADFQQAMERFWCLRWIKQQGLRRIEAVVLREDLVRLKDAPFYTRIGTLPDLERGRHVLLEVMGDDELDLSLDCRFLDVVDAQGDAEDIEDEPTAEAVVEMAETDAADGPDPTDQRLDDAGAPAPDDGPKPEEGA